MDFDAIDARVQQLLNYDKTTGYAKQKDSLQKELEGFLSALPGYVTLTTVTPEILKFPNNDGFLFNYIWGKTLREVIRMCLEFEEIRKQRFAPSGG